MGCPISIPFLPKVFVWCMGGVSHVSRLSEQRFSFWPPKSQKLSFLKAFELKKLFSCISWEPGVRFPFRFFPQFLFDVWEVWVMFQVYRNNGLRFDLRNRKNSVFESLLVDKVIYMHIIRTGCPIPILFLPIVFGWCMGGMSHVSRLSEQRFAFWPPKPKKLNFWKTLSWKSCFHAYLENWVSDSHSVSSYSFCLMYGRCESFFKSIGTTVWDRKSTRLNSSH